jgi:hypothetical protein
MLNRADGLRQRRRAGSDDGGAEKPKSRLTLESFDLYTKVRDEEQVQTTSGATGSSPGEHLL